MLRVVFALLTITQSHLQFVQQTTSQAVSMIPDVFVITLIIIVGIVLVLVLVLVVVIAIGYSLPPQQLVRLFLVFFF